MTCEEHAVRVAGWDEVRQAAGPVVAARQPCTEHTHLPGPGQQGREAHRRRTILPREWQDPPVQRIALLSCIPRSTGLPHWPAASRPNLRAVNRATQKKSKLPVLGVVTRDRRDGARAVPDGLAHGLACKSTTAQHDHILQQVHGIPLDVTWP